MAELESAILVEERMEAGNYAKEQQQVDVQKDMLVQEWMEAEKMLIRPYLVVEKSVESSSAVLDKLIVLDLLKAEVEEERTPSPLELHQAHSARELGRLCLAPLGSSHHHQIWFDRHSTEQVETPQEAGHCDNSLPLALVEAVDNSEGPVEEQKVLWMDVEIRRE